MRSCKVKKCREGNGVEHDESCSKIATFNSLQEIAVFELSEFNLDMGGVGPYRCQGQARVRYRSGEPVRVGQAICGQRAAGRSSGGMEERLGRIAESTGPVLMTVGWEWKLVDR